MRATHGGFASDSFHFFLNGQKTRTIWVLEGNAAATRTDFTSLLDFAGPCARLFSGQMVLSHSRVPR